MDADLDRPAEVPAVGRLPDDVPPTPTGRRPLRTPNLGEGGGETERGGSWQPPPRQLQGPRLSLFVFVCVIFVNLSKEGSGAVEGGVRGCSGLGFDPLAAWAQPVSDCLLDALRSAGGRGDTCVKASRGCPGSQPVDGDARVHMA